MDTFNFLPVSKEDMQDRGWWYYDFLVVTADAYVDHPSFGTAIIARCLEAEGYRTEGLAQPDWHSADAFRAMGKPRYGVMIGGGNIDSMVAHYTAAKRKRSDDAYTPGGKAGRRPDRACTVYARLCKAAYPEVPVVIGGLEASLRRFAHYDYWDDAVRPSILVESGADLLSFGMGERSISQIARAFAQADYQEMKDALAGNKYNSDLDEIRRRVQNNALGPLSFLSKANSWALSAEDNLFKRLEYTRSLASYITAHGWDPANMTHSQLQAARTHAMNDALEATFQEASQVASAISRFEQTNALTRVAVGGAFPFKGVPINIAKEGFRYSPAGLMKAITADAAKVKRGEMTAADMIDNLSSGLTGTEIAMLGYWLSSLGLVTAGAGEDDKENLLDMANGSQNYSLNIGSWSYTIDWAAPAVLPLFIGAEFETMRKEQAGEEGEEGRADQRFGHGLQALGRMFEPMLDMTVLSGVSSTIQSATYSQGNPLTAVGGNLVQNFGGQVVPTLLGQIARTVDPVRRSTYTDKDSGIPTSIQRFIQTQQNKIPGLSQRNVPYLNVWGEETVNENLLIRTLQNFVSPGYIARRTNDGLSDELKRLNSLGYEGVLPSMRQKGQSIDLDQDGEKERLTREQWEAWQRSQGQTAKTLLNDLLSSQSYQNMTDNEKAAAVKRTLDYSKESGKLDAGGSEEGLDKWVLNAREYARDYGGGSPQGFFDAYNRRAELGKTDYDKGIQQGLVEDYINSTQQSQAAKNYLLDAIKVFQQIPANSGNYNKAKAQGYTDPEEISALLRGKKSADTNGNGNYTQKELSDYIKSQTTDPAEQERLWNVYKNSNWKKTWAQVSSGSNGKKKSSARKSKGKGTFYLY